MINPKTVTFGTRVMQNFFSTSISRQRAKTTSFGLLGATAIALATLAAPVQAAPVTVGFEGQVDAVFTSDDTFAQFLTELGFTIPTGNVSDSVSGSITVDDDPAQYLDGDLSLGYDLLSSTIGMTVDQASLNLLDNLFDLDVSGSGQVTYGTQTMDYDLKFDHGTNEFKAVFQNFDPANEILSSCAAGECDWVGDFNFSLAGVNIFDPNLTSFAPTQLSSSQGSFKFKTNAQAGGTIGDFELETSNEEIQAQINEVIAISKIEVKEEVKTEVPEPSSLIGFGVLLGLGAFFKQRDKN